MHSLEVCPNGFSRSLSHPSRRQESILVRAYSKWPSGLPKIGMLCCFILAKNDVAVTEFDGVVIEVSFADKNVFSLTYRVWNTSAGT